MWEKTLIIYITSLTGEKSLHITSLLNRSEKAQAYLVKLGYYLTKRKPNNITSLSIAFISARQKLLITLVYRLIMRGKA